MNEMLLAVIALIGVAILVLVVRMQRRSRTDSVAGAVSPQQMGASEIEAYIRAHISEIARESFPDNPDVTWHLLGISHTAELILAEVEPQPDEVGYPRFKLGFIAGASGPPVLAAAYCLDAGAFVQLFTTRRAPRGLPRSLP